jgi:CRP-like cAMP-binding protein
VVEVIAGHLNLAQYADGECIFREGDREDFMAFIVSGNVDIAKEGGDETEAAIVTLHPRTHLGRWPSWTESPVPPRPGPGARSPS